MDSQISKKDKLIVYFRTAAKIFRGGGQKAFSQASQRTVPCRQGRHNLPRETHHLWEERKI